VNKFRLHQADCYEREADVHTNSFLDKNELEPKVGSVPRLCEN